jgi:hypothetical protein
MIGRADIEGSKSDVAMNAWPPQASYPCGNFSDTYCLKLATSKRIEKPRFHGLYSYWKSRSSQHLSFCSMRGFCPRWADLRTPSLFFERCTAPVKLPAWYCTRYGSFRMISDHAAENMHHTMRPPFDGQPHSTTHAPHDSKVSHSESKPPPLPMTAFFHLTV